MPAANDADRQGLDLDPAGDRSPQSRFPPGTARRWAGRRRSAISFWKASDSAHNQPRSDGAETLCDRRRLGTQMHDYNCGLHGISTNDSSDLTSVRRVHAGSASLWMHDATNVLT